MDPSELDRLDLFQGKSHDPFGNTGNAAFKERMPLESNYTTDSAEIVFKQGINPNKILKIRTATDDLRNSTLLALKQAGITEFNGMPVEDLVVTTAGSGASLYKSQLQPAGY